MRGSTKPPQWNKDSIPFGQHVGQQKIKLPPADPNNPEFKAIQDELAVLEDAVDAVSDALMAESVYQVVRGNPLHAPSYDGSRMPLETLVERETIRPATNQTAKQEKLRLAAEAGQHFLRMLR